MIDTQDLTGQLTGRGLILRTDFASNHWLAGLGQLRSETGVNKG